MNTTEERLILDAIQDAAHEHSIDDNQYSMGILRGLDTAATVLNINPKKVAEAMRVGQKSAEAGK